MKQSVRLFVLGLLLTFPAKNLLAWDNIIQAAGLGKVNDIQLFLNKGQSVNLIDDDGVTPLMMAAMVRKYKNIRFLIDNGADVKAKDNDGTTALMTLCIAGTAKDITTVKLLMAKGASINTKDKGGITARELCRDYGTEIFSAIMK
ncbi:ankyrin repeat domain-containing protein [Neptunomonas sp.]|uniref:ankyrin repeat domain-containing protein n=1 Tax=Neptunomonas sp. TaxID=1971898 RepID=UPI0025D0218E|nr:ankyrin repeat domain-containing protein [Neptunomonas sp.]